MAVTGIATFVAGWLSLQSADVWSGQACPTYVQPDELTRKTEFQIALPQDQAERWIDAYSDRVLTLEQAEELLQIAPREAAGQDCEVYQFFATGYDDGLPLFELVSARPGAQDDWYAGTLEVAAPDLNRLGQQAILASAGSEIVASITNPDGWAYLVSFDDLSPRQAADLSRQLSGRVRTPHRPSRSDGPVQPLRTVTPVRVHLEVTNLAGRAYPYGGWERTSTARTAPITRRYVWEPVDPVLPYEALGRSFEEPLDCFFRLWYPVHPDDLMQHQRPQWGAHSAGRFSVRAIISDLRAELRSGREEEWERITLELDLSELKAQQATMNYTVWIERQPGDHVGDDVPLVGSLISVLNTFSPSPEPADYTAYDESMFANITAYAEALTLCLNTFLSQGRFVSGCPMGTESSSRFREREVLMNQVYDPQYCRRRSL